MVPLRVCTSQKVGQARQGSEAVVYLGAGLLCDEEACEWS